MVRCSRTAIKPFQRKLGGNAMVSWTKSNQSTWIVDSWRKYKLVLTSERTPASFSLNPRGPHCQAHYERC